MSKNMNAVGRQYQSAAKNYNNAINQYSGNEGYANSINQAKAGAAVEAANSQAQAQTAARNAGMSKAQAAAKGASTASGDYLKSFSDQQKTAMDSGNNKITSLNSAVTAAQNEDSNRYNKAWGNLGGATSAIGGLLTLSDERLKSYKEISSKLKYYNPDYTKELIVEVKK